MIQFYYTGASKAFAIQEEGSKSLGGYVSSSIVPDNYLNGVFGEISNILKEEKSSEYVILAMRNENSFDVNNVQIELEQEYDRESTISVGATLMSFDKCKNPVTIRIPNINTAPRGVTFIKLGSLQAYWKIMFTGAIQSGFPLIFTLGADTITTDVVTTSDYEEKIKSAFDGNENYEIKEIFSYESKKKELYIFRKSYESNTDNILVESNSITIGQGNFGGGATIAANLGSVKVGEWLVLYFKRDTIKNGFLNPDGLTACAKDLIDYDNTNTLSKEESSNLVFDYEEGESGDLPDLITEFSGIDC